MGVKLIGDSGPTPLFQNDPPSIGYDRTVRMCGALSLARGMLEFRIFLARQYGA
jgi:hypothetical protein